MVLIWVRATLRARLNSYFRRTLQSSRFFEAPMPSLFHVVLPVRETCVTRRVYPSVESCEGSPRASRRQPRVAGSLGAMSDELDVEAMISRFQARARAVRQRSIPPVEGVERKRFVDQARIDFLDYAMIGDAEASLEDGVLTLRIDLRQKPAGGA